jgi:hypothetical protein
MKTKTISKFKTGDKVCIKGMKGTHVVTWPMMVAVPTIVDNGFELVETPMYKFITKERTFYAYETDCILMRQKAK